MVKKLSEWVPKIIKKSTKSKPGPHRVLPCALQCPKIVPGPSQYRPRVLQDAKVEAPSMPNDTHGHHKPENRLQKWQESGIQDPASQHTFQQRNLIKQKPNNENLPNQSAIKAIRTQSLEAVRNPRAVARQLQIPKKWHGN